MKQAKDVCVPPEGDQQVFGRGRAPLPSKLTLVLAFEHYTESIFFL